jgi:diamine N-acetyltransferase
VDRGPDITLRPSEPADVDFFLEAQADPEAAPNVTQHTREAHLDSIASGDDDHLIILAGKKPVGFAIITNVQNPHLNFEIFTLVISARGRGYGQAAIPLILDRCFDDLGAHRVWLDAVGTNATARHVYEKIGFTPEGAWREAWRLPDGSWDSLVMLGMLDREWAEIRARRAAV